MTSLQLFWEMPNTIGKERRWIKPERKKNGLGINPYAVYEVQFGLPGSEIE